METPKTIVTGRHPCTIGMKSLFKLINERSPEGREARKHFEELKPTVQCNAVVPQKSYCWICGGGIDSSLKYPDRFAAQCDHVLPIAQGVIFLQLYSRGTESKITEAMRLEYEWSHAICNNIKNATVLIKGDLGKFEPDDDKIINLLENIRSAGIPTPVHQIYYIQSRMFDITKYINTLSDFTYNLDLEVCPRRLEFSSGTGGKTFKRKHNGRSVRKTTVRRNVSTSRTYRKVRTRSRKRA